MNTRTTIGLCLILLLAGITAGALAYPALPERIATHWNAAGEVDGYSPRLVGVGILPLILAGTILLIMVLPIIDPLRKNISLFRPQYNLMVFLLAFFFFYLHLATLALNLGAQVPIMSLIMPVVGLLFFAIGVLLKSARRNWTFGIRTPWTLSNEIVWNKTHALGSTMFMTAGILTALATVVPDIAIGIMLFVLLGTAAFLCVYSFLEYRRIEFQQK
jgi:uncharacterized membrane protein